MSRVLRLPVAFLGLLLLAPHAYGWEWPWEASARREAYEKAQREEAAREAKENQPCMDAAIATSSDPRTASGDFLTYLGQRSHYGAPPLRYETSSGYKLLIEMEDIDGRWTVECYTDSSLVPIRVKKTKRY